MAKINFTQIARVVIVIAFVAAPFMHTIPARAANPNPELGVATGGTLLNIPDEELQTRLQDIKNLGAKWVRVDFSWSVIQPKSYYEFDFRFHDKVVVAAENLGLKVFATVAYTPKWARQANCAANVEKNEEAQQKCAPRDLREFTRFAHEVAFHYRKHGVLGWEVWNEPNLTGYWKYALPDGKIWVTPQSFARLATATAQRIHEVKPGAIVITGGLAPVFEATDKRGMRQGDFIKEMLPHLTKKNGITGIGIHPYTWPAYPTQKADWNAMYTVDGGGDTYNLRKILDKAGRTDLDMWGTEYGASTVSSHSATAASTDPSVPVANPINEANQARMIKEGVQLWYAKPRVGALFVYADHDKYLRTVRNEGGFGLRRKDGTAKPAHTALRDIFSETRAAAAAKK